MATLLQIGWTRFLFQKLALLKGMLFSFVQVAVVTKKQQNAHQGNQKRNILFIGDMLNWNKLDEITLKTCKMQQDGLNLNLCFIVHDSFWAHCSFAILVTSFRGGQGTLLPNNPVPNPTA